MSAPASDPPPAPLSDGKAVREAVNQGFVRAEIASLADRDATRLYAGAKSTGTVMTSSTRVASAVENYRAAISCFLRALPSLSESTGAAERVRVEIRKMLLRIGELQEILRAIDPERASELEADGGLNDELNAANNDEDDEDEPPRFAIGDQVQYQVNDEWREGVISKVNSGPPHLYDVRDGETGQVAPDLPESRLRKPIIDTPDARTLYLADRRELLSEIVESERAYVALLRALVAHYLVPLSNPLQWDGLRSTGETVFSQKTVNDAEKRKIFGNVEEITGIHQVLCASLEQCFERWAEEVKLGPVIGQYTSFLHKSYEAFAESFVFAIEALPAFRNERASFVAIEENANARGVPSLDAILRSMVERPREYKRLLRPLIQRTRAYGSSDPALVRAYAAMHKLNIAIAYILGKKGFTEAVAKVEKLFSPPVRLSSPGRQLLRRTDGAKRIDLGKREHKGAAQTIWLFNDLILSGRPSKFFAVGMFRETGMFRPVELRDAAEYGPLALEFKGPSAKDAWIIILPSSEEKRAWSAELKNIVTSAKTQAPSEVSKPPPLAATPSQVRNAASTSPRTALSSALSSLSVSSPGRGAASFSPSNAPPASPSIDGYWVLKWRVENGEREPYYWCESTDETSWSPPEFRRAVATHKFNGVEETDMSFASGEVFFAEYVEGSDPARFGWTRARSVDGKRSGNVPRNRFAFE